MTPPWAPGLFLMLQGRRAGDRVELVDHDKYRRWFHVAARAWDSKTGEISHVVVRRFDDGGALGEGYIATKKGWLETGSKAA